MRAIGANGVKFPPLVVFKGKKDAIKEERLQKYIKKYKLCAKENAWADKEIFMKWLNIIFINNKYVCNMLDKILFNW